MSLLCSVLFGSMDVKACFSYTANPPSYSPHVGEYQLDLAKAVCLLLGIFLVLSFCPALDALGATT